MLFDPDRRQTRGDPPVRIRLKSLNPGVIGVEQLRIAVKDVRRILVQLLIQPFVDFLPLLGVQCSQPFLNELVDGWIGVAFRLLRGEMGHAVCRINDHRRREAGEIVISALNLGPQRVEVGELLRLELDADRFIIFFGDGNEGIAVFALGGQIADDQLLPVFFPDALRPGFPARFLQQLLRFVRIISRTG